MTDWRRTTVAATATHHLLDDRPLYADRFDEVLKFHAPGLAPVLRGGDAWHITTLGEAAYAPRHRRTFGFYEGLAAVEGHDGWHHIRPDGAPAYSSRYAWCGNYQGGRCAVRTAQGDYLHLAATGEPAYEHRWRYAGDYRDDAAVVQGSDGRSSHIDIRGELLHGHWFQDLDVFHKSFARARDDHGWMHVTLEGEPRYTRRFAAVEPFYNGQARVEGFDGALLVIDESGETLQELRPPQRSEFAALSADMVGFWKTDTIGCAVDLGVVEALPGTAEQVVARAGLHADRGPRLLRALEELGLVERRDQSWATTARGAYLRADHPWTLVGAAREYRKGIRVYWDHLEVAFQADGDWRPPTVFEDVAQNPLWRAAHHRMLESYALHDYPEVARALTLQPGERLIDAGGGLGVLAALVVGDHPATEVVVLDRPEVVAQAEACGLPRHVTAQVADLFAPWGVTGDAVVLARVLHDWDDERAGAILARAREALEPGGRIFVVEMMLSEDGPAGALCDLHLLAVTGGEERSASRYGSLLRDAGFRVTALHTPPGLVAMLEGVAE